MSFFGIGLPELGMLLLLGTVLFGPEKIPEYSRKAARVVNFLRNIANQAQDQLRSELGPEYADLELKDLNPKTLVQKHVLDAIQGDLDEIRDDYTAKYAEGMKSFGMGLEGIAEQFSTVIEFRPTSLTAW